MKNITFIYRDNAVYNKYVPMIVEFLKKLTKVEVLVFPQETSEEEIQSRMVNLETENLIAIDRTVERNLPNKYLSYKQLAGEFSAGDNLDSAFGRVSNDFYKRKWERQASDMFATLINMPEMSTEDIVVVEWRLNEHSVGVSSFDLAKAIMKKCQAVRPEAGVRIVKNEGEAVALTKDGSSTKTFIFDRHCDNLMTVFRNAMGYDKYGNTIYQYDNDGQPLPQQPDQEFKKRNKFLTLPLSDFPIFLRHQGIDQRSDFGLEYQDYIDLLAWLVGYKAVGKLLERPTILDFDPNKEFGLP